MNDLTRLPPLRLTVKDPDLPFCTDQWQPIHAELLDLARQVTFMPEFSTSFNPGVRVQTIPKPLADKIFEMRYADEGRAYVPMGRGVGRGPKPPLKQFRDYRYSIETMGYKHITLFHNKGTNRCKTCGHQAAKGKLTNLDYFTFYPTGEIFTWTDPLFLNGYLHADPRDPNQPPGSPLIVAWVCKQCYYDLQSIGYDRLRRYEKRYDYLARSFQPSGPSRLLIDRRVWLPGDHPDDRRSSTSRRDGDALYVHANHLALADRYIPPPRHQV